MPGERSYSQAAIQALRDAYYGTSPRPRVEDIKTQAAAGQLDHVPSNVQAELAQISRARIFELLRQDPRYNDQERREATLNTMRERLDTINTQGIDGWSRAREADKLLEALDNAARRAIDNEPFIPPPTTSKDASALAAMLTNGEPTQGSS